MSEQPHGGRASRRDRKHGRKLSAFILTLLAIEFLDELVDGSRQAAWPLIRDDLALSYTEIGLLLAVPSVAGNLLEPAIFILGDVRSRRALILGGGIFFTISLMLVASSVGFLSLMLAFILFSPSSGAFVSLSQATLMDAAPARREQNMARWAFAGSLGIVAGAIILGFVVGAGGSWRVWFGAMTFVSLSLVIAASRLHIIKHNANTEAKDERTSFRATMRESLRALRRRDVARWLILLELSNLMLDGLHGFLALYFVDVAGLSLAGAGTAIAIWTGVGLVGDFLLIPLLERVEGLRYLRWSALAMLFLFPAFLLAPNVVVKLVLLALMGFVNAGWYSILMAQLYASMPERSGTAAALHSIAGLAGGLIPFAIGAAASAYGLRAAMWLMLAGPIALIFALPKGKK